MGRAQLLTASWVASFTLAAAGLAGCSGGGAGSAGGGPVAVARSAVFSNGDFENTAVGLAPAGWTINTFSDPANTGITDTRPNPQTLASLNLAAGGIAETLVVGGATESQSDPDLGPGATLRYPKFGLRAALVNYLSPTNNGSNENVNQLSQTMTTTNADVDPTDNIVHVRFTVAPVLQSGGHPYNQQPYYYVELDNITKGTTLYQDFNASAQAGVPWQTVGVIFYTGWQLIDIGPGNAGLAVGDQVKLTVIASGCSQGGHFGRVYVDGIGSTIPSIFTAASGPSAADAGTNITYVVNYQNGGTVAAAATVLNVVIPDGTTYQSNSLPAACSGVAAGGTGTLSCALGSLGAGAGGTFTVTVNINAGTAGTTVTNGNYWIQATGVDPLLGPKVLTQVTSGVTFADVSITKTDGLAAVGWGQALTYTIQASNAGPSATAVTITDTLPAQLTGMTWTCSGAGGGTCLASGSGSINSAASLPVGATVTYVLSGSIIAGSGNGSVINSATATLGGGVTDPVTSNNTAVDTDSIGTLRVLTLTKTGAAGGSVTTVPASIACGTSCSGATGSFADGTMVVLTASPIANATFTGWGGACAAAGNASTCMLTLIADQTVTAAFVPPSVLTVSSGNNQLAAIGTAFAAPLVAHLVDSNGVAIAGATVVFTAPPSGASAGFTTPSVTTDAFGMATVTPTANATAGTYNVTATLSGTSVTATFSLTNGGPTAISIVSGNNQSAAESVAFAALVVQVVDSVGQLVPNVSVAFAAPTTGARAALGTSPVATGANGRASITAIAGTTPGSYSVTATVAGVATPVTFTLTNVVGAATSISVTSGSGQTTLISTPFAQPLVVTVRDVFSNAVSGAAVTFIVPGGAGASASLTPAATGTTNAAGQVTLTATANGIVGAYAVTASVASVVATATFALSNFSTLALTPSTVSLAPRASQLFTGSGDPSGAYVYALQTNASGGTINPATGAYTAGTTGNVSDVVKVTDSKGRSITATVTVGAGVSILPGPTTSVAPRGGRTFVASGGSGTGYVFVLTTNGSGGAIVAATGVYTAGAAGSTTDVVKVTDSLGNFASVTITVNAGLSLTPATPTTTPRATINLVASGGSGTGFVYAVTTNHSGATVDSSGKYVAGSIGNGTDVVTVTDSLGNVATSSITVSGTVVLTASGASTPPRGALTFSASAGSGAGFVFALSTNASGATINAATGAYTAGSTGSVTDTVQVTDSLGNVASANVAVGAGVSITPLLPAAPPRGLINLVASGGSGTGFTFVISTNGSGATIGASTGAYVAGALGGSADVVRATDSLGNFATVTVSVGSGLTINPSAPTLAPRAAQTFTTVGGSGASILFAITTNGSGSTINATTGAYVAGAIGNTTDVVTVSDSLGNTAIATILIGSAIVVTPTAPSLAPLGAQAFMVSGGSGSGYTFALSTDASGGSIDPATGAYLAGGTGGVTDVVLVTDSLGNTSSVSITVTPTLQATVSTLALAPRATATLAVTGGAGGATFALTINGSGATLDPMTGDYVAGAAGNTTDLITVTDQNGATTTITVDVGAGLSLDPASPSIAPRASITFTASGGSGSGYVYTLTANQSGGMIDANSGVYQAGATSNVVDVVGVTDPLGNSASVNISVGGGLVINPAAPQLAPRAQVTLVATGGSGTGYVFVLTSNLSGGMIDAASGAYQAGAVPGVTDQVTVTDSLGNTAMASIVVGAGLIVAPASAGVAPRGSVPLSASGGSGSGYVFTVSANNSGATVDAASGNYVAGPIADVIDTVTVTDSLGNTATATISVGDGLSIAAATTSTPPRGSVALTASGGSGNFTFALVTNGSGASIVAATGLYTAGATPSTTDLVEVTDDDGNQASLAIMVGPGISLTPAAPIAAPGGALTFAATGGSGTGYVFALSTNGSGGTVDPQSGAYLAGNTDDTTDVVHVTDSLGNTDSVGVAVGDSVSLNPPTSTVAPRGAVQLTAAGGSGTGYVFVVASNVSGGAVDPQSGLYHAGTTANVTDIVKVTDSLGKTATAIIMVGAGISITPTTATVAPAGAVSFRAAGGSGTGYQFAIATNGSGGTVQPTGGGYLAGTIGTTSDLITVTDSLGNLATATVTVGAALSLTPAATTLPPRGTLRLIAAGGAGDYAFAISTNLSGGVVNPSTGEYVAGLTPNVADVVTVIDGNGISQTATVNVGPAVSILPAAPTAAPKEIITFTAAGGSGTGFTWRLVASGGGGAIDATTGRYTAPAAPTAGSSDLVEVKDSLGNTARATVHLTVTTVSASGGPRGCGCETSASRPASLAMTALGVLFLGTVARRRKRRA